MDNEVALPKIWRWQVLECMTGAMTKDGESKENFELSILVNGKLFSAKYIYARLREKFPVIPEISSSRTINREVKNHLKKAGFTLIPPYSIDSLDLNEILCEIAKLQPHYSPSNTPAMFRRGELIRNELPNRIRSNLSALERIFSSVGLSCEVEGSDGAGRKNESAWVRIFDATMSPSATKGWYIVFHFSRKGDDIYVGLGCGSTRYIDGSFVALPDQVLAARIEWARKTLRDTGNDFSEFTSAINLYGNALSRQFEKAMALTKRYRTSDIDSVDIGLDLKHLCFLLITLYQAELSEQKIPNSPLRNFIGSSEDSTSSHVGQGIGLTAAERTAVELRAMEVARAGLIRAGYGDIKDVSKNRSYDFTATKNGKSWYIEVKGTSNKTADTFMLTASELTFHRKERGFTILALVADIKIEYGNPDIHAIEGKLELIAPWDVEQWQFKPITFQAKRQF